MFLGIKRSRGPVEQFFESFVAFHNKFTVNEAVPIV
jgi:hypothetical protein